MAIQSDATVAQRQKNVAKKMGAASSGRAEYEPEARMRKMEQTLIRLNKKITAIENKIKVMVKVTRDRNGRETIIVKEK